MVKDGIMIKYDDSNQYMFVKLVYDLPKDYADELGVEVYELSDLVFVIKRVAKVPFINDYYVVDRKDVVCYMTTKEFEVL